MGGMHNQNLDGWYPQMVFETITNERGNEIYIAVEDGLKGVTIVTRGPESEATNTLTKMEAEALLRCLSDAIRRPHPVPSQVNDDAVTRFCATYDAIAKKLGGDRAFPGAVRTALEAIAKAEATHTPSDAAERECTCYPDERPAKCPKKYAFTECLKAAALRNQSPAVGEEELAGIAALITRDVFELGDRTSPEDWPEAMLVTGDELQAIVIDRFKQALSRLTTEQRGNG